MLRWIISATVIMGAASALAQDPPARPAKVFTVQESATEIRRSYPAIVLPSQEVDLSFRVGGQVIELPVRGAQDVARGDLIARLDPRDFESQIAQLESQRDQAQAQLQALRTGARAEEILALEAAVDSATARLEQTRDEVERGRQLLQRGVVARAQLDSQEAELRVAEANLRTAEEQLAIGRSGARPEDIAAAQATLRGLEAQLKVARDNLADATLRAPFSGVIARREIENFTNIQPGQSVALLQAIDVVHLAFDVPGPDVTALTRGGVEQILNKVVFDALPGQAFPAEVVEFSLQADAATQTYRGRVAVRVPEGEVILPGMVGQTFISAPGPAPALMVPLTAVGAVSDASPFVWVVDNNKVARRPVQLGAAAGTEIAVTDGLSAGEVIIAAGVSRLQDGMAIRPVTRIGE